ncbi:phage protein NinX family protein [Cupriavidus sp. TMH.W2]|uniref:phage protein NinX family protein n=1 Tax=Cupriavidus sp. TMH.W2 TaxID=3434465 RepID=UPI003D77EBE4
MTTKIQKMPDAHTNTVSVKARDLAGLGLDWAVAKCEGLPITRDPMGFKSGSEAGYWIWDNARKGMQVKIGRGYTPSNSWAQGGPILDRERPHLCPVLLNGFPGYEAWPDGKRDGRQYGETALIAAMRSYVASKLGEDVDVPVDLVNDAAMEQARRCPSPCL